ncbi:MAG: TlpA family protein disulfide reductase [Burkholderiaceae bacterium]
MHKPSIVRAGEDRFGLMAPGQPAPGWAVSEWLNTTPALPAPTLQSLRGRVVVLHAFQMLCPGCVLHGLPQAQRMHAAFDATDVAVIGLHSVFEHHDAMTRTALAAFLHEFGIGFPVAIDAPGDDGPLPQTMRAYGLRGTPSLLLYDRRGRLRRHAFGTEDDLLVGAAVATLLAEAA